MRFDAPAGRSRPRGVETFSCPEGPIRISPGNCAILSLLHVVSLMLPGCFFECSAHGWADGAHLVQILSA